MKWTRVLASLAALLLPGSALVAQAGTGRVTGRVTQASADAPVSDVTVTLVGTRFGGLTGADGRYTIAAVPAGRYAIVARRVGFSATTDSIVVRDGETTTHDFALGVVAVTLQQQVVIGYGTQRRSDITGSVASITPRTETTPVQTLEQSLQGTVAGVQVTQASSAPGGGISIRIRGGSSINGNNEPLYVIDGFPIENDVDALSAGNGGRTNTTPANPLASLNPNDIESIEILKDASATAIYGARGANGVVIISTRRGQGTRPRVTLDTYTGTQTVAKRYDLLDAQEFAAFANEWARTQTDTTPVFTAAQIAALPNTDWQDQIFRDAPIRSLQLGVSGASQGANVTRYSVSGGVFDQEGVVVGSDFRRVSLRGAVEQGIGQRFRVSSNVLLAHVGTNAVPTDGGTNGSAGAVGAALQYYPFLPVRRDDGTYALQETGPVAINPVGIPNPVSLAEDVQDELTDNRALANLYAEYEILKGLRFRISGGADFAARSRDTYYPRTTLPGRDVNGEARRGDNTNLSLLNENTLTYGRAFGRAHNVNAVAGYTRQRNSTNRENILNNQFVSDITGFEDIGAGARPNGPSVGSGRVDWTFVSYLGRLNYTLLDRYLFTLTGRRDGSSRFGPGNQWGFFPSYALGWRLSEERYLRDFAWLEQLKLRYSWGETGNPSIRPYQSQTRLSTSGGSYTFNGVPSVGYYPSTLDNPVLGWETTAQSDFGVDVGLFDGRVEITGDIYTKKTRDLLLARSLPLDVGFSTVLVNVGGVRNTGQELGVNVNLIRAAAGSRGFEWSTAFNYARNRNRVTDLGGETEIQATRAAEDLALNGTIVRVGQPIGVFFGYQTAGILRDSASAAEYTRAVRPPSGTAWARGDAKILDVNGDSIIDSNDRTIIGNPTPDFTLGWTNTFRFRGLELTALLDGSYGAEILNLNMYRLEAGSPRTNILRDRFVNRWTPENPDAPYPRINSSAANIGADIRDDLLEDGTYTRLRTVTLAYAVPTSWTGRAGINGARLYVTGQNLVTWTDYSGFNPDVSSISVGNVNRGVDVGSYPLARTVTVGVNLSY